MKDLLDYPLAAVRSAFRTLIGWTAVMAITSVGSFIVARCIELGGHALELTALYILFDLAILAFFHWPVLYAFMATAMGWSLGLVIESFRFRLVVALVNVALWAAMAVWMPLEPL
jgi:hypothetical protein